MEQIFTQDHKKIGMWRIIITIFLITTFIAITAISAKKMMAAEKRIEVTRGFDQAQPPG